MKLLFLSLFLLVSCEKIADLDQTTTVYLAPGSCKYMKIKSNPTTGYTWTILPYNDENFSIEDEGYIPSNSRADGSGGVQIFEVFSDSDCLEGESIEVSFVYVRSWENIPISNRIITIQATTDETLLNL